MRLRGWLTHPLNTTQRIIMKLKNFTRKTIRVVSPIGGHVALFASGETRDIPVHLEDAAIRAGLVPLEDLKTEVERMAELEAAEREQAMAEVEAEHKASLEQAQALEDAAKKAKASEAAKKAAATRAANKEKETK